MATKLEQDNLDWPDIFALVSHIFDLDLSWNQHEVESAWPKSRSGKSEKLSGNLRESGNGYMKQGQWSKALALYNQAVIWAEDQSQVLCMALANRAFVWMKLEAFDKARLDLDWIIQIGKYPEESVYKVYQRLGIVLQKLHMKW